MQCSSLARSLSSLNSERQLDHLLRRHYLSVFLCNFPLRTPTCQMTNPKAKSHFLAPLPPPGPGPRRGMFEQDEAEEDGPPSSSSMRHCGVHSKKVLILP